MYESAPSSPKRRPIAFLPPPDPSNPSPNQLIYHPKTNSSHPSDTTPDADVGSPMQGVLDLSSDVAESSNGIPHPESIDVDGTPEDIRRRFFPTADIDDPNIEWMKDATSKPKQADSPNAIRYDLNGTPIPQELQSTLPTHLGLHHHGEEQDRAGYTLDELLLLSRSTVPAQRASMLGVLGKISSQAGPGPEDEVMRNKILALALEALPERGSVGIRAVEVLWIGTVDFYRRCGLSLSTPHVGNDPFDITPLVPLPDLLREATHHLRPATQTLPIHSLTQLLEVVVHLATTAPSAPEIILHTPNLVPSILHTFVASSATSPDPNAISLVDALVCASRSHARVIVEEGIADTVLKFVLVPDDNPLLLIETLKLYTSLGRYGLYANAVSSTADGLAALTRYVMGAETYQGSGQRLEVAVRYLKLLETWITCAIDPHKTSTPHDILWSQVVGWGWAQEVLSLRQAVLLYRRNHHSEGVSTKPIRDLLTSIQGVLSAWLEGCRVNGVRAGESEREEVVKHFEDVELRQAENELLSTLVDDSLSLVQAGSIPDVALPQFSAKVRCIHAAVRLTDLCTTSTDSTAGIFRGPLTEEALIKISDLCVKLAGHSAWERKERLSPYEHGLLQPMSSLLSATAALQLRSNNPNPAQRLLLPSLSVSCLLPGDEGLASHLFGAIINTVTPALVSQQLGWKDVPQDAGGIQVILPFLQSVDRVVEDEEDTAPLERLAPFTTTKHSIQEATTLSYAQVQRQRNATTSRSGSAPNLPLQADWCFIPLDALLHSTLR